MLVPSGPPGVQLRGEAHPLPVCLQPPLVPCRAPVSRRAYLPCLPLPRPKTRTCNDYAPPTRPPTADKLSERCNR